MAKEIYKNGQRVRNKLTGAEGAITLASPFSIRVVWDDYKDTMKKHGKTPSSMTYKIDKASEIIEPILDEYAGINIYPGMGHNVMGSIGDASFIGADGKMKGNTKKPVYKTPKSSIHYKKGRFPQDPDFYNDDNWETDAPGPSTNVAGKKSYIGDKSVPKNSIHHQDNVEDDDDIDEQFGMPMSADGTIDGGPRSMDPIAGKKTKKKKFADASKYGYPKGIKEMAGSNVEIDDTVLGKIREVLKILGLKIHSQFERNNEYYFDVSSQKYEGRESKLKQIIQQLANKLGLEVGFDLNRDNLFYFYTDGITEIREGNNEELLKNIALELKRFNPGKYYMKDDVRIDAESNIVEMDFRGLGNWIDDEQSGQDDYEDNDSRIWAPGEYEKYLQKFKSWASSKSWHKQVKLDINTSEKDWCSFSVTISNKIKEEKDYDTNIVPKNSIHFGERDRVKGQPKMKFKEIAQMKNVKTQGDWKQNLSKAVMDLTSEAEPQEPAFPVPQVPIGNTPEFPYIEEDGDGSMVFPVPGSTSFAKKTQGGWTFGDTPPLPASQEMQPQSACAMHGEPSNDTLDIPCSKKPLIKKLMMFIKQEQKNLHEGVALKGIHRNKVVKLNTIYEGVDRRFKTYVMSENNKIVEVHFGPKTGEDCGNKK